VDGHYQKESKAMTVIQDSEKTVVVRNARGRVDTFIGCVDTGRAELNVTVSGNETDLSLCEALEDEERPIAADNATVEGRAHTYILLGDEDLDGLLRLLTKAREVRRLAAAATPDSQRHAGG
jgi:hypothetical protein